MCPTVNHNKLESDKPNLNRAAPHRNNHRFASVHSKRGNSQKRALNAHNNDAASSKISTSLDDNLNFDISTAPDLLKDLVDYYRGRMSAILDDQEFIQSRVEHLASLVNSDEKITDQLRQREAQVKDLQRTVSDLQLSLFREREHVLRLYSELDRLKTQELEDKRKITDLLQLIDLNADEVTYFFKETDPTLIREQPENVGRSSPNVKVLHFTSSGRLVRKDHNSDGPTKIPPSDRHASVSRLEYDSMSRELESLKATVKSLRTQLNEQVQTAQERIDSLLDDRRMLQETNDTLHTRYEERLNSLEDQLKKSQTMLVDCTKEFMARRNEYLEREQASVKQQTELFHRLGIPIHPVQEPKLTSKSACYGDLEDTNVGMECPAQWKNLVRTLEGQLTQQKNLSQMYQTQIAQLEQELNRYRDQSHVSELKLTSPFAKLQSRLQLAEKRCQNLERRRRLETEGYRTDICALRKKMEAVERHLLQFVLGFNEGRTPQNMDISLLKEVEKSTENSVKIMDQLKSLKLKMYQLEDDLRKL